MEMYIHLRDDMNQVLAFNPNTYGKFEPVRKHLILYYILCRYLIICRISALSYKWPHIPNYLACTEGLYQLSNLGQPCL